MLVVFVVLCVWFLLLIRVVSCLYAFVRVRLVVLETVVALFFLCVCVCRVLISLCVRLFVWRCVLFVLCVFEYGFCMVYLVFAVFVCYVGLSVLLVPFVCVVFACVFVMYVFACA